MIAKLMSSAGPLEEMRVQILEEMGIFAMPGAMISAWVQA